MAAGSGTPPAVPPRTESLRDGGSLVLRSSTEDDGPAIARLHRRCSLETIFRRYFTGVAAVSPVLQRRLLGLHLTVVAEVGEEIVGLGHLAVAPDQPVELAMLVEDSMQRRGIGRLLADAALDVADAEGREQVVAYTLPSSVAVHTLLRRLRGGSLQPVFAHGSDGLVSVTLHLPARIRGGGSASAPLLSA